MKRTLRKMDAASHPYFFETACYGDPPREPTAIHDKTEMHDLLQRYVFKHGALAAPYGSSKKRLEKFVQGLDAELLEEEVY